MSALGFSQREIIDLLQGYIGISIAFAVLLVPNLGWPTATWISLLSVGMGFILHELAHKFVAQYYRCIAEFRANTLMILLAIALAYVAGIVFAAPGAVMIRNVKDNHEYGIIAAAGPITNVMLALLFWALPLGILSTYGLLINGLLAAFNMLPLGPLDGAKVLRWSKSMFAVLLVSGILLTTIGFILM